MYKKDKTYIDQNKTKIGEIKLMNCGIKATIIEYFNAKNITIQFEDGIIVKNKIYQNFKKGQIANPNFKKRVGETKIMNNGMKATIIEYLGTRNITVKFEDGVIVKNKDYKSFKKGNIANPNLKEDYSKRIGETRLMNCGMKCTIIEYLGANNITVKFQDGKIVKNKTYSRFKKGNIANPNLSEDYSKRIGETRLMKCGMKATIIEYINANNITVQFEDSSIVKNKQYISFKNGVIANKNLNSFTVFKDTNKEFTGTLSEISEHFNIKYSKFAKNKNLSLEEIIEIPLKRINQSNLTYKGQKGTMKELCKEFDKNYIEVYNKVKYNHTFEWAMDSTTKSYDEE